MRPDSVYPTVYPRDGDSTRFGTTTRGIGVEVERALQERNLLSGVSELETEAETGGKTSEETTDARHVRLFSCIYT